MNNRSSMVFTLQSMFKCFAFSEDRKSVNTFEHDFHMSGNSEAENVSSHLNMSTHLNIDCIIFGPTRRPTVKRKTSNFNFSALDFRLIRATL